jgi:hypothetical protein
MFWVIEELTPRHFAKTCGALDTDLYPGRSAAQSEAE